VPDQDRRRKTGSEILPPLFFESFSRPCFLSVIDSFGWKRTFKDLRTNKDMEAG